MTEEVFVPHQMPVMTAKCASCPFGAQGDPETMRKVLERVTRASQVCHHPTTKGKPQTHLCRGARDVQLEWMHALGVIAEPTDAAWQAAWEAMNRA